jgi:hypothetical protein
MTWSSSRVMCQTTQRLMDQYASYLLLVIMDLLTTCMFPGQKKM